MAMFSESGLVASGYKREREKMYLCEKCGRSLIDTPAQGWCCPVGHGCWWPQEELESPEDRKARCYHQGSIKTSSPSKGRKRKKPRRKEDFSHLYSD